MRRFTACFNAGERYVVVGPNGAGKSTLLSLMAGVIRPTEGRISLCGVHLDARAFPSDVRRRIALLGHQTFVYPELNAIENLDFFSGLNADPISDDARSALLERVGLSAVAHRPVGTYSRGMIQRLGIARVLAQDPLLWLLDEPTTGLDASGRRLLLDVLKEATNAGCCVVVVSHEPDVFITGREVVVRLNRGRRVDEGEAL